MSKITALLATARIANLPSVVCNVFTGMVMGSIAWGGSLTWDVKTIALIVAGCFLYIAGNFLNDWYDAEWDRKHRPERAIPQGLFPQSAYLLTSLTLALAGLVITAMLSAALMTVYVSIGLLVWCYTLSHKRSSYAIWIMGGCRAGLYVLGFVALAHGGNEVSGSALVPALGLLSYIAGISLLARYETRSHKLGRKVKMAAAALLLLPLLTHTYSLLFTALSSGAWLAIIAGLPFLIWTSMVIFQTITVAKKVSRLLAGIVLVDSVYLLGLLIIFFPQSGIPSETEISWMLVPGIAFFSALLLQKIAPAT